MSSQADIQAAVDELRAKGLLSDPEQQLLQLLEGLIEKPKRPRQQVYRPGVSPPPISLAPKTVSAYAGGLAKRTLYDTEALTDEDLELLRVRMEGSS